MSLSVSRHESSVQVDALELLQEWASTNEPIYGYDSPADPLFLACQMAAKNCFLSLLQNQRGYDSKPFVNFVDSNGIFVVFDERFLYPYELNLHKRLSFYLK